MQRAVCGKRFLASQTDSRHYQGNYADPAPIMKHRPFYLPTALIPLWIAVLTCIAPHVLHAQYTMGIELTRRNFLSMEPISATVTISNRSGADVVVGGRAQQNWMSFNIEDHEGRALTPVNVEIEDSFIFQAGATIKKRILITDTYAMSEVGNYAVKAVAYHAPTQQYYESNRLAFQVLDSKPYKEYSYGIPQGYPNSGRVMRHILIIFRDTASTTLYYRQADDRTGTNLSTYQLGPILLAHEPNFTMDSENRLHAFFLAAPKIFCHAIVNPDGKLNKRLYFRELDGNRPALMTSGTVVEVQGGVPYDPTAPVVQPGSTLRRASERPPGL